MRINLSSTLTRETLTSGNHPNIPTLHAQSTNRLNQACLATRRTPPHQQLVPPPQWQASWRETHSIRQLGNPNKPNDNTLPEKNGANTAYWKKPGKRGPTGTKTNATKSTN